MSGKPGQERPSCACAKTKCVDRRCSCFKARMYCSDKCECIACMNTECYRAFVEGRVRRILRQNPNAFDQIPADVVQEAKHVSVQSYSAAPDGKNLSDVRCSCQEIKCSNMNCECCQFMVGCSQICKCEECANSFGVKGDAYIITQEICVDRTIKAGKNDTGGITIVPEIQREESTGSV